MATKQYLINLNLSLNEIQNVVIHKLAVDPAGVQGQVIYNTVENCFKIYDGASWQCVRFINDAGTGTGDLWSADQIQSAIDTAVAGGVTYKGGLDASVPTPALNTITSEIGDMYTVTVAGTIALTTGTLVLEVGDVVIAEADGILTNANQWTVVEKNLEGALVAANNLSDVANAITAFDNIKQAASETATGVAEIATQAETNTGTDDLRIVTPLKLKTWFDALNLSSSYEETVVLGTAAGAVTINHALVSTAVIATGYESNEEVGITVVRVDANNITVEANGAPVTVDVVVHAG